MKMQYILFSYVASVVIHLALFHLTSAISEKNQRVSRKWIDYKNGLGSRESEYKQNKKVEAYMF